MVITYSVPSYSSPAFPISSPSPSSSSSWVPFVITQDEINSFYSIDRKLYSRLVIKLRWNPMGSLHVMALWIWLERVGYYKGNLVYLMLDFSDPIIGVLVDEAVMCLTCIQHEHFPPEYDRQQISLTQSLTGAATLSLRFFHENRAAITSAISKIVNDVCLKAFRDIFQEAVRLQTPSQPNSHWSHLANFNPNTNCHFPNPNPSPQGGFHAGNPRDSPSHAAPRPSYNSPRANVATPFSYFSNPIPTTLPIRGGGASSSSSNVPRSCSPPFIREGGYLDLLTRPSHRLEIEDHKRFLNSDITEVLNSLHIGDSGDIGADQEVGERRLEVPPDERTIFLTFSKGYPISENEVRDFFTRRFGDCFEAIYMQEVNTPGEQALYARLVVRPDSTTDVVLNGESKVKFAINGKHVWARKYVRKVLRSPSALFPSSPPSQSPASMHSMMGMSSHDSYPSIGFGSL